MVVKEVLERAVRDGRKRIIIMDGQAIVPISSLQVSSGRITKFSSKVWIQGNCGADFAAV